jgi:hypothetical protein
LSPHGNLKKISLVHQLCGGALYFDISQNDAPGWNHRQMDSTTVQQTKFRHEYGGKDQQTPAHLKLSNPVTVNKINCV